MKDNGVGSTNKNKAGKIKVHQEQINVSIQDEFMDHLLRGKVREVTHKFQQSHLALSFETVFMQQQKNSTFYSH